jgi:surfeit locus 1 family protein
MARRIPIIPTLLVMMAVGVMIRLGFWQLERLHQKQALLALYSHNVRLSSDVVLPAAPEERERVYFRHTRFECPSSGTTQPMAGHNAKGGTGWAHWGECRIFDHTTVAVNLGWSQTPAAVRYSGGTVSGIIAHDGPRGARVVADRPIDGLQPSAAPDPNAIPNNHLAYAIQWFLFALTALVIYALALRKRLQSSPERGGGAPKA